jgi:chromosome segregation ATPase
LNLNDEMELEHRQQSKVIPTTTTTTTSSTGSVVTKENCPPNNNHNNLATMTQIMRRKQMLTRAARRELEEEDTSPMMTDDVAVPAFVDKEDLSSSSSSSSSSSWAMLGCHMEESTLDYEGASELLLESSDLAITPSKNWKEKEQNFDLYSDMRPSGGGDGEASGISGVLTFLGESPLFDQTMISAEENNGNEVERNLCRSAEKVKRLEEHLLRSTAGEGMMLSPVNPTPNNGAAGGSSSSNGWNNHGDHRSIGGKRAQRTKEVTFAIADGLHTPQYYGESPHHVTYPKSPYYTMENNSDDDDMNNMSMQVQANPMNESAIISDDEASEQDFGTTSPTEGIEDAASDSVVGSGNEFGSNESNEIGMLGFESTSKGVSGNSRGRHGGGRGIGKETSPTRASLMERNHTLVKEVRFADQTCVALSERKKYYKNQVGQYKDTIKVANKENSTLRHSLEVSLQESAKLKVLVESLQAQKHQSDLQVEAYRAQIIDSEQTHRFSLETMEKDHTSHLMIAKEQINSLNERLNQSYATNATLQSTLDRVNDRLESKQQGDISSKELIASLKERVASADTAVLNANSSLEAMRNRITELEKLCDQQKNQLQQERTDREMIDNKREDLQAQCDDLHMQLTEWAQTSVSLENMLLFNDNGDDVNEGLVGDLNEFTPVKQLCLGGDNDAHHQPRTPTSNLLAHTLRSELKRRQHVTEKLERAEHQVTVLKDKIFDTKMDLEEAKADNALLEEELEERNKLIATLETELAEKDTQVDLLCEEIEDLRRDGDGAASTTTGDAESKSSDSRSQCRRDTISGLVERLDAVEETLEFTDDELIETKARLADTQELLEQTAGELERSEEELAIACSKVSDYEAQVDNLFKDLTEKEVDHANITKFSDFQSSTIETMKDKLSLTEKVNVELRAQLKSCFQSLAATEKILRTHEDVEGVAGRIMSEQRRKIARLLETMEHAPQDRVVPAEIQEFGSVSNSKTPEPHTMTAVCQKCMNSQEQLRFERDDANGQLQKAHELIQEFRDELSNQESRYAEQITSLEKQRTELGENLSAVSAELKVCQTENEILSATVSTSENAASQQLAVIRSNNSELIKENETLRVSLQSVELQLESKQSLLRAAQEAADSYRLDVSNAKSAFECLSFERDRTKASLFKVEKQVQELQELVTKKEKDIKTYKESLSIAQAEMTEQTESLKSRCDEIEAELAAEREGHRSTEGMLKEASKRVALLENSIQSIETEFLEKQNECQELIVQVKQIKNALEEAERERSDADGTISRLEVDLQDKKSVIFAYEESIISYKSDVRRLDNELQTTVQEKNNQSYRIQMLEQECNSRQTLFSEQLDRTKNERDATTAEFSDMINRLQNELDENNKSHNESEERSKMTILELNEAQRSLEEEIIRQQNRLDDEAEKYDDACRKLEDAQKEIMLLSDRLNSTEMDCNRLTTKYQDEIEELVKDEKRLASEKSQLEAQK